MQKKHLSIIALMLIISFVVTGCGSGGDISTRIVGHWGYYEEGESDPLYELYFGEFDEEGVSLCFYKENEDLGRFSCTILEENSSSLELRARLLTAGISEDATVSISEDDQRLTWNEDVLLYIDSETEP
jgi:predicted small secreted protein